MLMLYDRGCVSCRQVARGRRSLQSRVVAGVQTFGEGGRSHRMRILVIRKEVVPLATAAASSAVSSGKVVRALALSFRRRIGSKMRLMLMLLLLLRKQRLLISTLMVMVVMRLVVVVVIHKVMSTNGREVQTARRSRAAAAAAGRR